MESSAAAAVESAAAESTAASYAGESTIALHACHASVVIASEDAMVVGVATLLKASASETLLWAGLAAICAFGSFAAKSSGLATAATIPVGHGAIAIGNA